MGRTVKSSTNAESTVGKFLKWFAASLAVSPFSLGSSICLANITLLYIVRILSGHRHVFLDFHCLQVLDAERANFV